MRFVLAAAFVLSLTACARPTYTAADEFQFTQSCEAARPPAQLCACAWQRVKTEIPYAEMRRFEALSAEAQSKDALTGRLLEIRAQCLAASGEGTATP